MEETNVMRTLFKIPDAAQEIEYKIKEKTLRNWRSAGKYMKLFVKIGGTVYVDMIELQKIICADKENTARNAKRLGLDD
jgi:hypothetical protein